MAVLGPPPVGVSAVSHEASSSSSAGAGVTSASGHAAAATSSSAHAGDELPLHLLERVLEALLETGHDRRSTRGFVSALCTCTSWRTAGTAVLARALSTSHSSRHPSDAGDEAAPFVFKHPLQLAALTPPLPSLPRGSSSSGGGDKPARRLVQCTLRREVHSSALGLKVHRFLLSQDDAPQPAAAADGGGAQHAARPKKGSSSSTSAGGRGRSCPPAGGTFLLAAQRGLLHGGTSIHLDRSCSTAPIARVSSSALGGAVVLTCCRSKPAPPPPPAPRSSSSSNARAEADCRVLVAAAPATSSNSSKLCSGVGPRACSSSSSDSGGAGSSSSSLARGGPLAQLLSQRHQPPVRPLMALQLKRCTLPRRLSVALTVPASPGRPLLPLAPDWPAAGPDQPTSSSSSGIKEAREVLLVSKQPRWSRSNSCYVLNFMGRVKVSSVKNLQLVVAAGDAAAAPAAAAGAGGTDAVVLQFGKVAAGDGAAATFILDFDPSVLTCVQAFAVALSTFSSRLL